MKKKIASENQQSDNIGNKVEGSEKVKKKLPVLDILILISAAFAFICYVFYIAGKTVLSDAGGLFITCAVLLGTTLPIIFRKKLKALLKKTYRFFKIAYCAILCFYMVSFLAFSAYVICDSEKPLEFDDRQAVIIVCGCKVNGSYPSRTLAYRLNTAYDLLTEHKDAICIVTGGQGDNEQFPEAEVMKNYLVSKGISDSRILMEDKSSNTVENIEFSIALMKEKNIPLDSNVICVSTDVHTSRVAMLARERGLDAQVEASPSPYAYLYVASLVREYMSYAKYFIFG